jgi:large conductance mechanosensitive channel
MKSFVEEFKAFALRGNVVDLAIGIVIGAAFTSITDSLVKDIITPPIGLLLGKIDFANLAITLGGSVTIRYGHFIQAVVSFLITALALFFLIRFVNKLVHAERIKEPKTEDAKSAELVVLEEIRDTLKK